MSDYTASLEAPSREDEPSAPPADRGLAGAPQGKERSLTSDAAMYTAAVYGGQALSFIAGIVQKGLLGPVGTGFWSLMQTFWTLLTIASLGVYQGTARQVPAHRGRGDFEAAAEVSDTGGSFSLVAMAIAGVTLALAAISLGGGWAPEIRWGLVITGLLAPLRFLADYHEALMQATKRWGVSAGIELLKATAGLTITTVAVLWVGFYGMFVGLFFILALEFAYWRQRGLISWRRRAFHWRIEWSRVRELLSYGVPILIQGQLWYLFLAVDNLIVASVLDVRSLGFYALAVSVTSYILYLPKSIGATLFPRMTERFASSGDAGSVRHYATDTQRLLAYLLVPLFMGAAFFLLPVLIRQGLPSFAPAIPVVHIMVAASFFISLVNMPVKLLITTGLRWQLAALMSCCLVVNAVANYLAVAVFDWGLEGAAWATAFSYFVTFIVMTGFSLTRSMNLRRVAGQILELLAVFAYTSGALWAIEALFGSGAGHPLHDVGVGALKLAVFVVAMIPWMALAERRYGAVSTIAGLVRSALSSVRARRSR
jgi:O-antigen/teichoic acid export membrane protein